MRLRSGPVALAALDYGNRGAAPMLLLHGIRDLAWSMDSIAQAFRAAFHVVSIDLRGHGDSEKPGAYTLIHFVTDLRVAVQELGLERPVLVGHSLGAQIAAHYAGVFPESVAACVLIEGLGAPHREGEGTSEERRQLARSEIEALAASRSRPRAMPDLEAALARVVENHPRLDSARARFLTARGTCPHPDGGLRWKWDPAVQGVWSSVSRQQTEERWGWVECPVLVVTGARSGEWWTRMRHSRRSTPFRRPPSGDDLAHRLTHFRDAHHVEIPDAGHMIHFDRPHQLNQAIDAFLEAHLPDSSP